ncbi:phosphoribosylformylglycinamidine synthase subunit PurL [Synechococcus sp. CS-602]|uniref:phosphoribosylformylglycinamidine synthase subunit PurL n=1 Tax=Synechococcaceae TaxID=1890426 RepID=UPI0008FF52AD|nr:MULTISPECIES: phosphoribosylformylglycinamidine synthase subunit PurL [Synechococcaceae]MCT4363808.1 phosphoribosylformylglycinamidine synthase subunit PurL [Candidatus Regnicoccus frigidus MAG-AL1]APD47993.1 phosphoribosylformylglycinamidine synthase II [Synechococcus sp. SynAce01]MCT0201088.1 phosphoribosylformylglycinamidine synthase subunit PurL [Synechococcus sp. CS-603]MCT0204476.1 phosphoribosylformylglycinamidine synthase subunit PurL [Synechococcus sp. CS-602]MCT0245378.1 phosphori
MVASSPFSVADALRREGLSQADYEEIVRRLGREPNRAELGMFGVMWSEHCCYRNSRPLLSGFPTTGPRVLVGPGENAGVVDLGEGQRLAFKIESHNHPSAVEPFQGAATGVGGILRDIFTMGARPIALLNALRFGPLDDPRNVGLIEGVVAGIAHYGNCVGVPTVGGEVAFDPSYSGNPLVNAMALGLMETEEIVCSGAAGVGNPVVYVGSTTGRDGMGGASFASAELSAASLDDRPAVQVGDPFLEKGLIEACLEAFKSGDVVAAQDMGAAGLTCSCSEMAAKGGLGIELDLDLVPARETGMTAYEFLLSESQERMLFVVKPGREEALMARFRRWGLQAAVVGRVLEENVVRVLQHGAVAAEVPANALADDTPINHHELLAEPPAEIQRHWQWREGSLPPALREGITPASGQLLPWGAVLKALLDDPTIASKRWVYRQYDQQVQANTVLLPGGADAAVLRLRPQDGEGALQASSRGVAATVDCPNRWVALDPQRGAIAAVAEAARNLSCVGAEPLAVTDNLNFPSPETPTGYWQLAMACRGISEACTALATPVTGGNVSLYNETRRPDGGLQPIQPTPVVGMVGLVHDLTRVTGLAWKQAGDTIWLLGVPLETGPDNQAKQASEDRLGLAGSSYLERIHGRVTGRPPRTDLALECRVQALLREAISQGLLASAHDLSDGGLAVAAAECCIASGLGAELALPTGDCRLDRLLFAEGGARVLVSVSPARLPQWQALLASKLPEAEPGQPAFPAQPLGQVAADGRLQISAGGAALLGEQVDDLAEIYEQALPSRLAATA